jgi:hypothetical protein
MTPGRKATRRAQHAAPVDAVQTSRLRGISTTRRAGPNWEAIQPSIAWCLGRQGKPPEKAEMTPKKVRRAKLMANPPRAMIPGEDAWIASITRRAIWCIFRLLRRASAGVRESPTAAIPRAFVVRLTRHVSHRLVLRPSAILIFRRLRASL